MPPILLTLVKWCVPLLMPVLIAAIKSGAAGVWEKVPAILRPLVAAILGALAGIATGDASTGVSLATSAGVGAGLGALGKAIRDAAKEARPAAPYGGGNESVI